MSDKAPKNSSDVNPAENEEDLENLSADEKAAFEKIMSQISDSDGASEDGTASSPESETSTAGPVEEEPRVEKASEPAPTDDATEPGAEDELTDDQQAALDNIMAEINGSDDMAPPADPPEKTDTEDDLTDDQQAALDSIMAEINGTDDEPVADETPKEANSSENLTDDEQAALNDIMAEIKGSDDEPPPEEAPKEADADENLSEEQQAALDNIMAEIKGSDDEPPPVETPKEAGTDKDLTDEQQAALDNIMTEIKGSDDEPAPEEAPKEPDADENLTDAQQAALDNIMAEIKGSDDEAEKESSTTDDSGDDASSDATPGTADNEKAETDDAADAPEEARAGDADGSDANPGAAPASEPSAARAREELSMDEFNQELNELLEASPQEETEKSGATASPDGSAPASGPSQAYAMLQEVEVDKKEGTAKRNSKTRADSGIRLTLSRSALVKTAVLASALLIAAGAYYGYDIWFAKIKPQSSPASSLTAGGLPLTVQERVPASAPAAMPSMTPVPESAPRPEAVPAESDALRAAPPASPQTSLSPFELLASDLASARQRLHDKMDEIKDLKAYYRRGITEERTKIEKRISKRPPPSFKQARADNRIRLSLQAIQRRQTYVAKLDTPLNQLEDLSEKMLYLERRNRLFETLDQGLSGLPIAKLKKEVADAIAIQVQMSKQLSIDHVKASTPTLATIWDDILEGRKNSGNGKRGDGKSGQNQKIAQEMCKGNYNRKYLLTAMTVESAKCLSGWPGKDLYLNNLTDLPPKAAEALAHWPGEWLSLNGLKSISAESARHLSQWPGRRLSLNGLTHLSSKATSHLSQWQGEQLEMVGLNSIGRWENYGTRLYLSEQLKRKLKRP